MNLGAATPSPAGRRRERNPLSVEAIVRHLSGGREGKKYHLAAKTLGTWRRYHSEFTRCQAVADDLGLDLFPIDPATGKPAQVDPATLEAIFEAIVEKHGGVVGSITIAKQALKVAYRLRGYPSADWQSLREFLQGIKRLKGEPRRQARPLLADDLETILDRLDPTDTRHVRNGAILALGWGAALRSDEMVTLGWDAPGLQGKGFVTTSGRTIEVHLDLAKTAQDGGGQDVTVPAERAPLVMAWLDRWAQVSGRAPGRLVFCQISRSGRILPKAMAPMAVTRVVREHVLAYLLANGMGRKAAAIAARLYRSHSLRAGYATSAAAAGVPEGHIRDHCRHKNALTTAGYIRLAERLGGLGLKGLLQGKNGGKG